VIEESEPDPAQLIDGPSIPFRLSELATFAPDSVAVGHQHIEGLVSVPPRWHPLDRPLGEECGDPHCPYRCYHLALHPDSASLLRNYLMSAELNGVPFAVLAGEGLRRDIYRVRSTSPLLVADLGAHPINYRVPVTAAQLRRQPPSALCWEILRILRDRYGNSALRLPPGDAVGGDFAVHADAAAELEIVRLGTLDEEFPVLSTGLLDESAMSRLLMRLVGGMRRAWPEPPHRNPRT
jgi:hypothetical protein